MPESLHADYLQRLVAQLAALPTETEWVEFKVNNADPQEIGEYVSALSNSATLCERETAYLIWGIDDATHDVVGTDFDYRQAKRGNQELELWLVQMTNPKIDLRFHETSLEDKRVTVLEIPAARREPTKHGSTAFVRVGTNKKPLVQYPDKEARLWRLLDTKPLELHFAKEDVTAEEVVDLLDYPAYYRALGLSIPTSQTKILEDLSNEGFIEANDAGGWDITNLGALMLAVDLGRFGSLSRRAVRVIQYRGTGRTDGIQERSFSKGYLVSHEEVVQFIMAIIPQREVLDGAIRREEISFPEVAIRELVANLMVHQDLSIRGTTLMIELFDGRIEFTNPGSPLVPIDRILDMAPKARNDAMASFLHKCGICEERGSGYDKIIGATSTAGLIAPHVTDQGGMFTRVTLYSKIPINLIGKRDRIWTCYMLACLACVNSKAISNADVRRVFDLSDSQRALASRIISDTYNEGLIRLVDLEAPPKTRRYLPFWA